MEKTMERVNRQDNITNMVFTKFVAHCQNTKWLTIEILTTIKWMNWGKLHLQMHEVSS